MEYRVDFLIGMVGFIFTQGAGLLFLYIIFQNIQALAGFSLDQILLMYGLSLIPKGIIVYSLITSGYYLDMFVKVGWIGTCLDRSMPYMFS